LRSVTKSQSYEQPVSVLEHTAPGNINPVLAYLYMIWSPVVHDDIQYHQSTNESHHPQQKLPVVRTRYAEQPRVGIADRVVPGDNGITAGVQPTQGREMIM
jgi:hypothetical protein